MSTMFDDIVSIAYVAPVRKSKVYKLKGEIERLEADLRDRLRNREHYREWESVIAFRDHVRWLIGELREARAGLARYQQPELFDLDAERRWDLEAIAQ